MKFTLSWLKDHLETDATLEHIVEKLTDIGLEVESVDDRAAFKAFKIARVLTAVQHPDADKLRVLSVDAGDGKPVQVVCGAPNAAPVWWVFWAVRATMFRVLMSRFPSAKFAVSKVLA
jgi:phenylalanyl-tRNA synthetase beta chain